MSASSSSSTVTSSRARKARTRAVLSEISAHWWHCTLYTRSGAGQDASDALSGAPRSSVKVKTSTHRPQPTQRPALAGGSPQIVDVIRPDEQREHGAGANCSNRASLVAHDIGPSCPEPA